MSENSSKVSREVTGFNRVTLKDFGEVIITQGEEETLTIEADEEILPKIMTTVKEETLFLAIGMDWMEKLSSVLTSLISQKLTFYVTLKEIRGLEIFGAWSLKAASIVTDQLDLGLRGAGSIHIHSISTQSLEVELPGAGSIEVDGKVVNQMVDISGAGSYRASKLESKTARVTVKGLGSARIWATDLLDVDLRGLGSVEYYGSPKVKEVIQGLGSVRSLGNP